MLARRRDRTAAIEDLIDANPVAAWVRQIMANRSTWTGSASDLLRAGAALAGRGLPSGAAAWPKSPRELAGRLRRAQTFLRVLGIHIAFGREGRAGTRVIRIRTRPENTVSTVSIVRDNDHDPRSSQPPPSQIGAARDDRHRPGSTAADDADGADAKAAHRGRSAARRATNSLYRSAAPITPQSIASATSAHGGRPPVSTRSKPPADCGGTRE